MYNSLFVGQLYEDKSLVLHACDLIFFTTDLQIVNYYSTNQPIYFLIEIMVNLLANLSQRLIGELIGYSWSGVRPASVRHPLLSLTISNIFFSKTACPIKAKFYVEPPCVWGTKVSSRHLGHMTKMAATPIYGKNPSKIFFSRTSGSIFTKLGM